MNFPRVLDEIQAMWGYRELNAYFHKLTMDERGDCVGFPTEVREDIYFLLYLHQQNQFPIQCTKSLSLLLYPLPSMPRRQPT